MNKPKILLYVVFHDHWDFIEECITSIKENLKTIDFDVLIIDSTNNKYDIDRLQKFINGFRLRKIPKNLPHVVQQVYEEFLEEYEFIMRLDADDFLYPRSIKTLFDSLNNSKDYGAAYGSWSVVDKKSREIRFISPPMEDAGLGFHGACTLFKTSALKNLNLRDMEIDCQDGYATYLFLKLNQVKIVMLNDVIFGYRRHDLNISSNKNRLQQNRQQILNYFYNKISLSDRIPFDVVLVDTDLDDLFESDRKLVRNYKTFFVRDGFAVQGKKRIPIPKSQSLVDFFMQLEGEGNFIFINIKKLGERYSEGLLASFIQYVSMMRPKITTYVEPITNRVLVVNDKGNINSLNVDGKKNSFCFTELNGLHSIMRRNYLREHALYSYEILNKIVNYEF